MAGMPLHYYYFGQVLSSVPMLIAGTQPAVGYNLMAASIPALGAGLLAALGLVLVRRGRLAAAFLLPLLVLLTGNLAWPTLLEMARGGRWFDLWWATSRVIPGFAIDEYPLWTALFADLHGHFIALPVLLATLLWGWLVVTLTGRRWIAAAALCGLGAAVLAATNPWDVFVLTAALAVGAVMATARRIRGLLRLAAAGVASLVAGLPYIVELVAGIGAGAGGRGLFLTDADFAPAWAVMLHFGPLLAPLLVLAAALLLASRWWITALPLAAVGVALGLWMSSSAAALGLAAGTTLLLAALRSRSRTPRLLWSMAALAMFAVAACERFTLIDRMNTIFKVYNGAWVLLAVAVGGLLLVERGWRRRLLAVVWLPLQLAALVNLPLGVAQGVLQPRVASPRPTLDGQAFLELTDPETWFLVQGLAGMARPGEVVAEAADIAYADYTRIAMHTGQPTVVGWPWHLQQRGQSRLEIDARYRDLTEIFGGRDPLLRRQLLDRYRVRWITVAGVERRTYGLTDEDPFAGVPGVVRVAGEDDAALYMVRPVAAAGALPRVVTGREIPSELTVVASMPPVHAPPVRALAVDADGVTAVLPDGTLHDLDRIGRVVTSPLTPDCTAVATARRDGTVWAACSDGRILRRDPRRWRGVGAIPSVEGLAAGNTLWAWGPGGLWQRRGAGGWEQAVDRPVAAAAALAGTVAVSDGRRVWTLRGDERRRVGGALEGVRALAWQGASLWALADGGLYRSGGAVLPWRRPLSEVGGVSAMAGSDERLWLVLDDGLVVQHVRRQCGSPWQGSDTSSELQQPRGLAVSSEGWLAVADTGHDRVVWYTMGGTCLDSLGQEGSAPGAFTEPTGLALAADGSLAVTDTWNGRVQILHPDGSIRVVGANLYGPRGVLWAEDGSLLVADTGNRRLLRFRAPRWGAEPVVGFDGPVVGLAGVRGLIAAAVPAEGVVVLVEPTSGAEVRRLAVPGWDARQQQEGYLTVLPSGDLVASAPDTGELWRLDPEGEAAPTRLPVTLPGVTGLAVLPDGNLLAAQTYEHRLVRVSIPE
jgi:YYY domain-containing protein